MSFCLAVTFITLRQADHALRVTSGIISYSIGSIDHAWTLLYKHLHGDSPAYNATWYPCLEICPRFFSLDLYFYSRTSHDTQHAASMSSSPTFSSVPYFSRESYAARMYPHRGACLRYLPITTVFPPRVAGLRVSDWSALLRARI